MREKKKRKEGKKDEQPYKKKRNARKKKRMEGKKDALPYESNIDYYR